MAGGSFRVHRKVISHDTGLALLCCYRDCEKPGYEIYKARVNDAAPGHPPKIVQFVFCSERHKMMWVRASQGGLDGYLRSGDGRYI